MGNLTNGEINNEKSWVVGSTILLLIYTPTPIPKNTRVTTSPHIYPSNLNIVQYITQSKTDSFSQTLTNTFNIVFRSIQTKLSLVLGVLSLSSVMKTL